MTSPRRRRRIARPDTRWQHGASAYAEDRIGELPMNDGTRESWMGTLAGQTAEPSHPGFDTAALPAKGGSIRDRRDSFVVSLVLEEDAGPARHPFQTLHTEKARCANTGLLRSSLDWMLSGMRLDRCQTA